MQFVLESRGSSSSLRQWVQLYNFTSQSWVQIDTRLVSLSDLRVVIPVPNPTQYLEPSTRQALARISYKADGPTFSFPWTARIDQAVWNVR
ncbi:MAG: hypothetical protein M3R13_05600 [Armatimonadota bacterium]|nr:hypothetical protein [Armatimonadota bacterium]